MVADPINRNEDIISLYSPESPFTVYDQEYWWGDQWKRWIWIRD